MRIWDAPKQENHDVPRCGHMGCHLLADQGGPVECAAPAIPGPRPAPFDPAAYARKAAPEPAPYPAPTVTSRDGVMEPAPRAMVKLKADMEAAGWRTLMQYAHGCMPHSTHGTPLAAKPSWALRMERDGFSAVAVYRGGAWDAMYTWSAEQPHRKAATITVFRERVLGAF